MARIPNEERFSKARMIRVLRRMTLEQIDWLLVALEHERRFRSEQAPPEPATSFPMRAAA